MNIRRALIVLVVGVVFVAGLMASRSTQATTMAQFAEPQFFSRPFASHGDQITNTWYCPGVPAADPTVGGEVVITNPTDAPIDGHVTLLGADGTTPVTHDLAVPARGQLVIDADQAVQSTFVSAVVELEGGEGMVEQRALYPAGHAVASCTTHTSSTWYFADGWTVEGSTEQLIITNPFADTASVDLTFFTKSGRREPAAFQGDSISPHSVKVIQVAESGLVDEAIIGVEVDTVRGQTVVGRAQHYIAGNRLGYTLNLGAPAPSEQLWFADGEKGPGITEQYVIFNPTDEPASVVATVLGVYSDQFVSPDPIEVPAGKVVTFDLATVTGLPDGRHSMVFATLAAPSVVIERVLTRPTTDGKVATTVVMAMTPDYAVGRWYVPIGVDVATDDALVLYTPDNVNATVTVKAIGPGGEVAVPALEAVPLPASGLIAISLTDPSVFGRPLVVESTNRIFVERLLPRGNDLEGASGSWALPECGPCNFSSPPP